MKGHSAGPERRALSGLAPPASTVLRIPLRGTRLRRAVDPGDLCQPSGPNGEGQAGGQARKARGEPPNCGIAGILHAMTLSTASAADEGTATGRGHKASAVVSLSWSGIAFAAGAVALASTSSLAVVATLSHVDALSTIALALAILSFILQIGLFAAQSWTSGQQVLHSEELNSDTRAILAEVRENARGTNQLISDQFEKVLAHLLETTKRTVNESIKGPEAQRLNEKLDRELRSALLEQNRTSRRRRSVLNDQEKGQLVTLQSYPSDPGELKASTSALGDLAPGATADLAALARDEIESLKDADPKRRGLFKSLIPFADDLLTVGLVEKSNPPEGFTELPTYEGEDYFVLTDKGRQAARVFARRPQDDGKKELAS
jgi:hypothetical protein